MQPSQVFRFDHQEIPDVLDVPFGSFEKYQLRAYALAVLSPEKGRTRVSLPADFVDWYQSHRKPLNLAIEALDELSDSAKREHFCETVIRVPRSQIASAYRSVPAKSSFQKRLDWVSQTLQLPRREAMIVGALVRLTHIDAFQQLREAYSGEDPSSDEVSSRTLLRVCGLRRAETNIFSAHAPLSQLGLIENRGGGDFAASRTLLRVLAQRSTKEAALTAALLGKPAETSLELCDFQHLGQGRQQVLDIIGGALKEKARGAGVLFYGAPGTGKTEFARLLGRELKAHVVFVGETGNREAEPSRADRVAHLSLLSSLADRIGRVILVIDEADDIFNGIDDQEFSNRSGSKVFMNRIVESCPVPTIWISNFPERLGQSILRRMLHAVAFEEPDQSSRQRIVERLADAQSLRLTDEETVRLASLQAPPALIEAGLKASRLASGGADFAIASSKSLLKAMGRRQAPELAPGKVPFDTEQSSADTNLSLLTRRVQAVGPGPFTFLFSGAPGTGKSAYARHLALSLGLDVLEKRGSDLLGMYVGESEKRIAEAFEEAADRRLFLIMDEVDSLLADRRNSQRSWEVSQVNEMLTWMERHPSPFAATTNYVDHLDPATMRRFLFKVTFGPMSKEQAARAFEAHFGCVAPQSLAQLHPLTPGDFALVRRKAEVFGSLEPLELVSMLAHEISLKQTSLSRPVGFGASL
ncbi:AAA family ATPase [Devosia sp. RR2S18]|uniref:AAA family ATPase n=1 Tax=Devosia rhizosphaerae TaxID=3049774 RepID=UPI00253FE8CB|nr:ATP-binding protein [Devosia sp. RR2S18]WIJ25787.1 ATP-binding protein [Devosia sp. RR2S18]